MSLTITRPRASRLDDLRQREILEQILRELKIANFHNALVTEEYSIRNGETLL